VTQGQESTALICPFAIAPVCCKLDGDYWCYLRSWADIPRPSGTRRIILLLLLLWSDEVNMSKAAWYNNMVSICEEGEAEKKKTMRWPRITRSPPQSFRLSHMSSPAHSLKGTPPTHMQAHQSVSTLRALTQTTTTRPMITPTRYHPATICLTHPPTPSLPPRYIPHDPPSACLDHLTMPTPSHSPPCRPRLANERTPATPRCYHRITSRTPTAPPPPSTT